MQYFWEICCSHGEDVLPLSEEAHDWRCRFRSLYDHAGHQQVGGFADWGLYGNGPYSGFYAVATLQSELRNFESTLPRSLVDQMWDYGYRAGVADRLLENKVMSQPGMEMEPEDEDLVHRIQMDIFNDFFRVYDRLFDQEWKVAGDVLLVSVLSKRLQTLWVAAGERAYPPSSPELERLSEKMMEDLTVRIRGKARELFDRTGMA